MTADQLLTFLANLGPVARDAGIESVEVTATTGPDDISLRGVKFRSPRMPIALPLEKKPENGELPKKPQMFGGRSAEEIRNAIPNWGDE